MDILRFEHDCYVDDDTNPDTRLPVEFVDWFSDSNPTAATSNDDTSVHSYNPPQPRIVELEDSIEILADADAAEDREGDIPVSEGDNVLLPVPDDVTVDLLPPHGETEGAAIHPPSPPTRPARAVGTWKDGPAKIRKFPIDGEEYEFNFNAECVLDHPVAMVSQRSVRSSQPFPHRLTKSSLLECSLLQDAWTHDYHRFQHLHMDSECRQLVDNICDPRVLECYVTSSKTSKYNDDNPSYDMAMRGPFQAEYYEAMRLELTTLASEFKCWDLVPRQPGMNVLPSTWAFKVKRYPDGSVKKFKARFCARGDRQLEGIDYFETWAPVVQWSTIRIVMIIAAKLRYCSAQCDITAAFIHAFLPPEETIYVEQPSRPRPPTKPLIVWSQAGAKAFLPLSF